MWSTRRIFVHFCFYFTNNVKLTSKTAFRCSLNHISPAGMKWCSYYTCIANETHQIHQKYPNLAFWSTYSHVKRYEKIFKGVFEVENAVLFLKVTIWNRWNPFYTSNWALKFFDFREFLPFAGKWQCTIAKWYRTHKNFLDKTANTGNNVYLSKYVSRLTVQYLNHQFWLA